MHDEIYMLWLSSMVQNLGSRKLNALLEFFGTAKKIFTAQNDELEQAVSLTPYAKQLIASNRSLVYIEGLLETMETKNVAYFSRMHERFPAHLKEITDPPVGIFCMGALPPDDISKVAIIGSRKCSEYGRMTARMLAKPLAEAGIVIVSGMARGVDSMAHRGTLEGGGKTIAVLGCGIDICYPAENRGLRDEITENGCVVSEYPPSVKPNPGFFPARNRIISGLSLGVIVTEAAKKSGTLITVDQAAEQGREVMAVPGNITSKLSEGTNHLVREGAYPVFDHTDVMSCLRLVSREKNVEAVNKNMCLAQDEKQVYDVLSFEAVSYDTLSDKTGIEHGLLYLILTGLEVKGLANKLPGSRYVKNH